MWMNYIVVELTISLGKLQVTAYANAYVHSLSIPLRHVSYNEYASPAGMVMVFCHFSDHVVFCSSAGLTRFLARQAIFPLTLSRYAYFDTYFFVEETVFSSALLFDISVGECSSIAKCASEPKASFDLFCFLHSQENG